MSRLVVEAVDALDDLGADSSRERVSWPTSTKPARASTLADAL
jgi:hypothetical protein